MSHRSRGWQPYGLPSSSPFPEILPLLRVVLNLFSLDGKMEPGFRFWSQATVPSVGIFSHLSFLVVCLSLVGATIFFPLLGALPSTRRFPGSVRSPCRVPSSGVQVGKVPLSSVCPRAASKSTPPSFPHCFHWFSWVGGPPGPRAGQAGLMLPFLPPSSGRKDESSDPPAGRGPSGGIEAFAVLSPRVGFRPFSPAPPATFANHSGIGRALSFAPK